MKNREIVAIVRAKLKQISGDDIISDRAILSELKSTSNLYIKRETDKRKLLSVDSLFTTIPCLEMVEVPLSECCVYRSPCTIRRSVHPLPKVGEGLWGYIIESVQSLDGSMSFSEGSASRYANLLSMGLKKKPHVFWIQNSYLYVTDPDIAIIRLRAYFEEDINPILLECDENATIDECSNPLDDEFRCPGYIIQNVITTVENSYYEKFLRLRADDTDNDNPTT